jgi:LL-diaminopimelate aminotransferase
LEFFRQVVDFARRHGLLLCHDAPYCDVTYNGYVAPSVLQVPGASEVAVEFNSLSKTCNMAGWRMGMAVGSSKALASLAQVKSNVDSGIFRPLQEAAVRALAISQEWLSERNAIYQERMDIILEGLDGAGMGTVRPRASLYAWAPVLPDWASAEEFAVALLEQVGVSVAPGSFFGPSGEGYVRVSVTAPTARVREAMQRLRHFRQ